MNRLYYSLKPALSHQVILGIIFPPLILLLDFRLGDDATYHAPGEKEEGKDKEDDTKSSKVNANFCSQFRLLSLFIKP